MRNERGVRAIARRAIASVATLAAVLGLTLVANTGTAQAAIVDLHKATTDIGGVHVAVVLRKDTSTGRIFGFCSLSGNSGVTKRILACHVRSGSPTSNVTQARGPAISSTNNVASTTSRYRPVNCSVNFAAYIGYDLNFGTDRTGRTLFVRAC